MLLEWKILCYVSALEPANSFIIGDEIIGALSGWIVHAISRAADNHAIRVTEFGFIRHRWMPADGGQSLVLLRQCHTAILWSQWHRRIIGLSGERRQRSVACVIETAQTFESKIGENVRWSKLLADAESIKLLSILFFINACVKIYSYIFLLYCMLDICSFVTCKDMHDGFCTDLRKFLIK